MNKRGFLIAGLCLLTAIFLFLHCSSGDKGTNPGSGTVDMGGNLILPSGSTAEPENLTVSLGSQNSACDTAGRFEAQGQASISGVAVAFNSDTVPLLMSMIPDPRQNLQIQMSIRSTAKALVFLNPFVLRGNRDQAVAILDQLDELPQLDTLENLLRSKMIVNPNYLLETDVQIKRAVGRVVIAYLDTYNSHLSSNITTGALAPGSENQAASAKEGIVVVPFTPKSGHWLTYEGHDQFKITNAYGRWAIFHIPRESKQYWLFPNGSMLDGIASGQAWGPSEFTFPLHVEATDDTVRAYAYGYGIVNEPDNYYHLLTADEKTMVNKAGLMTFFLEFCGNAISVISETRNGLSAVEGYEEWAKKMEERMWLVDFLFGNPADLAQIEIMVEQKQYGDLTTFLIRKVLEKIATDENYRLRFEGLLKYTLPSVALTRIDKIAQMPSVYAVGEGFIIGDKVTSVLKTIYGLLDARYKTSFKIWKTAGEFGSITGYVFQKESPFKPIRGATVRLSGDDNNPIPNHPTTYTTDVDGGFRFDNVLEGAKTLTATANGYNGQSAGVTVEKNKEATVTIKLSRFVGTIKGAINNDIFVKARAALNPQQDTLFDGPINVYAHGNINGQPMEDSKTVSNGRYAFDLIPGNWWIIAMHDDYKTDSVQVNVVGNEIRNADRSLLMKPMGRVTGDIWPQGAHEPIHVSFTIGAATQLVADQGESAIVLIGADTLEPRQEFDFYLNLNRVRQAGTYHVGPASSFAKPGNPYGGFGTYFSETMTCTKDGDTQIMPFLVPGVTDEQPCDCGITTQAELGDIYLTQFGKDLGDIINGSVTCKLAGYQTCSCEGVDTNNDGKKDQFTVDCTTLYLDINFHVLVGSFLWNPSRQSIDSLAPLSIGK